MQKNKEETLRNALDSPNPSTRLRAALAVGSDPQLELSEVLIARYAQEPDFFVREMLTWALIQNPSTQLLDQLAAQLCNPLPQARAQTLHILSKLASFAPAEIWRVIGENELHNPDVDVAMAAWRAAVAVAPQEQYPKLIHSLITQLDREDPTAHKALARAFLSLGQEATTALQALNSPRASAMLLTMDLMDSDLGDKENISAAQRVRNAGRFVE